jgi:hypothetical protein
LLPPAVMDKVNRASQSILGIIVVPDFAFQDFGFVQQWTMITEDFFIFTECESAHLDRMEEEESTKEGLKGTDMITGCNTRSWNEAL